MSAGIGLSGEKVDDADIADVSRRTELKGGIDAVGFVLQEAEIHREGRVDKDDGLLEAGLLDEVEKVLLLLMEGKERDAGGILGVQINALAAIAGQDDDRGIVVLAECVLQIVGVEGERHFADGGGSGSRGGDAPHAGIDIGVVEGLVDLEAGILESLVKTPAAARLEGGTAAIGGIDRVGDGIAEEGDLLLRGGKRQGVPLVLQENRSLFHDPDVVVVLVRDQLAGVLGVDVAIGALVCVLCVVGAVGGRLESQCVVDEAVIAFVDGDIRDEGAGDEKESQDAGETEPEFRSLGHSLGRLFGKRAGGDESRQLGNVVEGVGGGEDGLGLAEGGKGIAESLDILFARDFIESLAVFGPVVGVVEGDGSRGDAVLVGIGRKAVLDETGHGIETDGRIVGRGLDGAFAIELVDILASVIVGLFAGGDIGSEGDVGEGGGVDGEDIGVVVVGLKLLGCRRLEVVVVHR